LFVDQPTYLEVQLAVSVAALEHMVACFESERKLRGTLLEPVSFEAVSSHLRQTLETLALTEHRSLTTEQAESLAGKLPRLNDASFRDRLDRMLDAYGIPKVGLEGIYSKAISARNRLLHGGRTNEYGFSRLYLFVAVSRELLKRIFMTLLKYSGQYLSFLNGPEWVEFPPTRVTLELDQSDAQASPQPSSVRPPEAISRVRLNRSNPGAARKGGEPRAIYVSSREARIARERTKFFTGSLLCRATRQGGRPSKPLPTCPPPSRPPR